MELSGIALTSLSISGFPAGSHSMKRECASLSVDTLALVSFNDQMKETISPLMSKLRLAK